MFQYRVSHFTPRLPVPAAFLLDPIKTFIFFNSIECFLVIFSLFFYDACLKRSNKGHHDYRRLKISRSVSGRRRHGEVNEEEGRIQVVTFGTLQVHSSITLGRGKKGKLHSCSLSLSSSVIVLLVRVIHAKLDRLPQCNRLRM